MLPLPPPIQVIDEVAPVCGSRSEVDLTVFGLGVRLKSASQSLISPAVLCV